MKIVNPAISAPAPAPSVVTAQDRADLQAALGANREMDFDTIRAAITAGRRARFTDEHLQRAAQELGWVVES